MRAMLTAATLVFATAAFAGDDPMASRFGNTTLVLEPDGAVIHMIYRQDQSFLAQSPRGKVEGRWSLESGTLCLQFQSAAASDKRCGPAETHAVGDVWFQGMRRVTLVPGVVMEETPEVLAALAAASRVGNTIVAREADGAVTRIYWRPDHSFTAVRGDWKSEGTWKVAGSSLFLHYDIARPKMGSDEEMKNATPRKVGDVWGFDGRSVTLLAGDQTLAK